MNGDQAPVRTYGGWRRSRDIGLLGLGPAATFITLAGLAALMLVAAVSLRALLYSAPFAALAAAAGLIRADGVPLARLAAERWRWWRGGRAGHTRFRAEDVIQHAGVLQLPGVLAGTELLSVPADAGSRFGLVRDRHTGFLTATIRVAPVSTWLADPADSDRWVANWAGWLASLGYIRWLRHVTVTTSTAPDPGTGLLDQVTAAIDPYAPRTALEIMDQLVAAAPAAAADVDTWVSITLDPDACPARPGTVTEAADEVGRVLDGLEAGLAGCGVAVLGRARAADLAGIVRTAYDPVVRGAITRLLAGGVSPELEEHLDWAAAGPLRAVEHPDRYAHDSGTSVSWAWREAPRQNVTSDVLARLLAPGGYPKRVALQYRPLPAAAAARVLDNEVRAAEFRHEYSRRTRRDVTARDTHDHARARQAADEEARGAGVGLLSLYVTVTVTDPADMPRAVAVTEAAAEASKIRLQRLDRGQAAAFTATLPCGVCLPELARRLRH